MPFSFNKLLGSILKMEGDSSQSGINNNWRLYFAHTKEKNSN